MAGEFAGTLIRLGGPIGAVIVALGFAAKALDDYNHELAKTQALATGVGRTAGMTAGGLEDIAKQAAAASGTTVGQAKELEEQLLKTGSVAGDVFQGILNVQRKYANATGQDLGDAQAELVSLFEDPARGADMLQAKFGSLSEAQRKHIQTLMEEGNVTQAQTELLKALGVAVGGVSGNLGGLRGAWDNVASGASRATTAMLEAIAKAEVLIRLGPQALAAAQAAADAQKKAAEKAAETATANRNVTAGVETARSFDPNIGQQESLAAARARLTTGIADARKTGQIDSLNQMTVALQNVTRAQQTQLTVAEKAHQLALLDEQANKVRAKRETEATRAELGEIAAKRTRISLAGEVLSASEVEQRASDAAAVASARQQRARKGNEDSLRRQAEAMEAAAKSGFELADAYLVGDAASMKAEAHRKALTDATRKGADIAAQERRQLALTIAEEAITGAKLVANTRAQALAQEHANDSVASGVASSAQAQLAMQRELQLRALIAARDNATDAQKAKLTKTIDEQTAAWKRLDMAEADAAAITSSDQSNDQVEMLKAQLNLLYATNVERAKALAMLAKEQEIRRGPGGAAAVSTPKGQKAIKDAGEVAVADANLEAADAIKQATQAVTSQRQALELEAKTLGMTTAQAVAYGFEQGKLNELAARGVVLTDDQKRALHDLAGQYGATAAAAKELERQQRGAADAANFLADEFSNSFIDVVTGAAKAKDAVRAMAKDILSAQLRGALRGDGPFAGVMGTDKQDGPGQMNHGILSQLFGGLFGVGKNAGGPQGTQNNPVWVQVAGGIGAGGGQDEGGGGILGSIFGRPANDNRSGGSPWDEVTRTTGGEPWSEKPGSIWGDSVGGGPGLNFDATGIGQNGFDFMASGGQDFITDLTGVFQQNSTGGFIGALKNLFGGMGGGGGAGGGLGGLLNGLFGNASEGGGGAGFGAILGSVLATVAHRGLSPGSTSSGLTRAVDPTIFLHAPRLHEGLKPGEFPAILEQGEGVTPRGANSNHASGNVTIIVNGVQDFAGFNRTDRQTGRAYKQRLGL
jgi:hypothetical protein